MGIINTLFGASFVILGFTGFMMYTEMPKESGIIIAINVKQIDEDSVQCEIEYKGKGNEPAIAISPMDYCTEYAVGQEVPIKNGAIYQFRESDDF